MNPDPRSRPVPLANLDRIYVGGTWERPSTGELIDVVDPATEELAFRVAAATAGDVHRATQAARDTFDRGDWALSSPAERAVYLTAIAGVLRRRADDVAAIWPREAGALAAMGVAAAHGAAQTFDDFAALAAEFPFRTVANSRSGGSVAYVEQEPVGVVGAIVPWNGPLGLAALKVAPALLAGCTVVLKASPEAPGELHLLAEAAAEVGLPAGVLNVIVADREVSEVLVRDPNVDKISFTGSTAAGRRIASLCGERIARCTLELGGKSAALVLDDFDVTEAARTLAASGCRLAGQVCASLTRVIVSRSRHDALVDALAAEMSAKVVGDPFDPNVEVGPLATSRQRDRVEGYIAAGLQDGARLVAGGTRPTGLSRGWYVAPTVFADVDNRSAIAREEIFGPVLSVIACDDEDDAVRIANDSPYGLNASVFTADARHAHAVARRLRAGTVGHNGYRIETSVAFGGFKQSGMGREGGAEGLRAYLETKTVVLAEA